MWILEPLSWWRAGFLLCQRCSWLYHAPGRLCKTLNFSLRELWCIHVSLMSIELHILIGSPVHCRLFWWRITSPVTLPFDFPSRLKTTWPGWVSGCVALSTLLPATLKGTTLCRDWRHTAPFIFFQLYDEEPWKETPSAQADLCHFKTNVTCDYFLKQVYLKVLDINIISVQWKYYIIVARIKQCRHHDMLFNT